MDHGFRFRDLGWRAQATYIAHAFKAVAKQHHRDMAPVLRRFIREDSVVLDIGGHAGQFAKLFARIARRGRVYTFEPSAYALSILRMGVRASGLGNITVVPEGLGDAPGTHTLTTPLKERGSRRYGLAHLGVGGNSGRAAATQEVRLTTIDAFAAKEGMERLDFIKADVEGWELRMLMGGAETIGRHRPTLMIELDATHLPRAGDTLEGAWDTLLSWGYRPWLWLGAEDLEPIPGPRSGDAFWLPD
ncbi:MAG: FkbM family methyltransferase [Proteobacteria bacterium]|nr:FkbM family methyltransferase [Pseudomonadota bacterium]